MDKLLPLNGIKVLELASVLAGPAIGMFLAELGAEVFKVENLITEGDVTRKWKLPSEDADNDISGYFSCVNWGKKSIAIDISSAEGGELIYSMAEECDIILVSYKPGDAEKLKVDYASFRSVNQAIIYAHVTGYGLSNHRAGFDAIIQAETGFTYMNGEPDGRPTKMPVALMDVIAAHHLKEAILIALFNREKTGAGCYVDASLFRSGISSLANQATNWLTGGLIPERIGSDHPNIVPYGTIFKTSDNKGIVLAAGTDKQFQELCHLLNSPDLAYDTRYDKNQKRVRNKANLLPVLQRLIEQYDRETILNLLSDRKIPAGGVYNMKEVFETPEAKEMVIEGDAGGLMIKGVSTIAFKIDGEKSADNLTPPPHYGQHTEDVLKILTCKSSGEIAQLAEKKIIYISK
jgi:crotonobetainyl-CoA:carnitine CoA-transferase CaiB-like acyl-CoA transferase